MRTARLASHPEPLATNGALVVAACLRPWVAVALLAALPLSAFAQTPDAYPSDDEMTCEMIGRELAPGAMAVAGAMAPERDRIAQQVEKRSAEGQAEFAERSATAVGCAAGAIATAGVVDPCAATNAAYDAAAAARAPRRDAEDRAMTADLNAMMANMNGSLAGMDQARIQHLVALAEAKNCHGP
jgi:hypothetical protein